MSITTSQRAARRRRTSANLDLYVMQSLESRVFLAAGGLDTAFGAAGKALIDAAAQSGGADAIAVQTDGKVLILGHDYPNTSPGRESMILMRLNANGTVDSSFGGKGTVRLSVAGVYYRPEALKIQADGKILVGGAIGDNFMLIRFNATGTVDGTFGTNGKAVTAFSGGTSDISAIGFQNGKIVVAGTLTYTPPIGVNSSDFALARYTSDGKLDATFGSSGKVITDMRSAGDMASSIAIQSDGKILVGGTSAVASGPSAGASYLSVARYTANGQLDTTFNKIGRVFAVLRGADSADNLIVQSNGKIVAGGRAGSLFGMVRWLSNGTFDKTFGPAGSGVSYAYITTAGATSGNMIADSRGWIYVTGSVASGTSYDFGVAKFNAAGVLDTTFGTKGLATDDFSGRNDRQTHLAVQAGKLILFGQSTGTSDDRFALSRHFA